MKHSKAPEQEFWQQVRSRCGLVEPPLDVLEKRLAQADDDALSTEQIERMVRHAVASEAKVEPEHVLTEAMLPRVSWGRRWMLRASAVVVIPTVTMTAAVLLWGGQRSTQTMPFPMATAIIKSDQGGTYVGQAASNPDPRASALGTTSGEVYNGLATLYAVRNTGDPELAPRAERILKDLNDAYVSRTPARPPSRLDLPMGELARLINDRTRPTADRLDSMQQIGDLIAYGIACILHMPADGDLETLRTTYQRQLEHHLRNEHRK